MGVNKFRDHIGKFAPTPPLVLLFARKTDDLRKLKLVTQSLSKKFKSALILKAPVEKNAIAIERYNVTRTPAWVAFKNHVPVGRVTGTSEDQVTELIKVVFGLEEEAEEGGGIFAMLNPFS